MRYATNGLILGAIAVCMMTALSVIKADSTITSVYDELARVNVEARRIAVDLCKEPAPVQQCFAEFNNLSLSTMQARGRALDALAAVNDGEKEKILHEMSLTLINMEASLSALTAKYSRT